MEFGVIEVRAMRARPEEAWKYTKRGRVTQDRHGAL
jgi:hypothetical protein